MLRLLSKNAHEGLCFLIVSDSFPPVACPPSVPPVNGTGGREEGSAYKGLFYCSCPRANP